MTVHKHYPEFKVPSTSTLKELTNDLINFNVFSNMPMPEIFLLYASIPRSCITILFNGETHNLIQAKGHIF